MFEITMGLSIGTSNRSFIFQDVVRAITQTQEVVNVHLALKEHTTTKSEEKHVYPAQKEGPPPKKEPNKEHSVLVGTIHKFMSKTEN